MVIQRIQTLLLILAAGMIAVILWAIKIPFDNVGVELHMIDFLPAFILGCVAGAMVVLDIFLFSNLKLQITVASISLWLTVAFLALGALLITRADNVANTAWVWPTVIGAGAVALIVIARTYMLKDYKLLRSSNRIR